MSAHRTGIFDADQEIVNAEVALDNAVFQLLSFYAGLFGEMHELDADRIRRRVAWYSERLLARDVYRIVDDTLRKCGVISSRPTSHTFSAPAAESEREFPQRVRAWEG